jgi:hypothetical protein
MEKYTITDFNDRLYRVNKSIDNVDYFVIIKKEVYHNHRDLENYLENLFSRKYG